MRAGMRNCYSTNSGLTMNSWEGLGTRLCYIEERNYDTKSQHCHISQEYVSIANVLLVKPHCKKERVVLTKFGHLSCTRNCCISLGVKKYIGTQT